ncbi:MAG: DUF4129 domain-containing protein [Desulfobacteraceae bacterium]|nr:MAG: DUF4129 domain-containing protein [Desulfobacteraceae bacterium]
MKTKDKLFSFLLRSGMELSWLYAWAYFMSEAMLQRAFPLPEGMGTFLLAALSTQTRWFPGRGWLRFALVPVVQATGLIFSALFVAYAFTDGLRPFFGRAWLSEFFLPARGILDGLSLAVLGGFILAFWIGGSATARRSDTYTSICHRFDLGVTALFVLYLIKFILVYKGGIHIRDPYGELAVFPFIIFSLLAMGTNNQRGHAPKAFLAGFRGIGLILSFSLTVLGLGVAAVLFFLPHLTRAAEAGFRGLKAAAGLLEPILVSILRFLFVSRRMREEPIPPNPAPDVLQFGYLPAEGGWASFLHHLIKWAVIGTIALLVLALVSAGLWLLVRWVRLKFNRLQSSQDPPASLREVLQLIRSRLCRLWRFLLELLHGYTCAAQLFGAVTRWGRRSGIPRLPGETPLEYGCRLAGVFPLFYQQIEIIVMAYHTEVYRETPLDGSHLKNAQAAWQHLRSPRHWPQRLKIGLFGNRQSPHG